jgi:hypothetical protein
MYSRMPVGDNQVVDLGDAGVLHRVDNAAGIARRSRAGIAGVHQKRFARRRNKQSCIAAFDIDHIDVERS